jgi:hypothetical protein
MASIVEWQSLKMQEYSLFDFIWIARFFEIFGIRRPDNSQSLLKPALMMKRFMR